MYVHKLYACIRHELVDSTFFTQWTNLLDQSYQVDKRLWPTFSSFDVLHSSHEWPPTMLSCGQHGSALSIGSIPRLRSCLATMKSQSQPWVRNLSVSSEVRMFVSVCSMCEKQTSVSHSSTRSEIISLDAGLRMWWITCSWFMGCSDRSVTFIETVPNHQPTQP